MTQPSRQTAIGFKAVLYGAGLQDKSVELEKSVRAALTRLAKKHGLDLRLDPIGARDFSPFRRELSTQPQPSIADLSKALGISELELRKACREGGIAALSDALHRSKEKRNRRRYRAIPVTT